MILHRALVSAIGLKSLRLAGALTFGKGLMIADFQVLGVVLASIDDLKSCVKTGDSW